MNYADYFIAGFQYKSDAEHYYAVLKERMAKFNLELEENKKIAFLCLFVQTGKLGVQFACQSQIGKPNPVAFLQI